MFMPIQKPFMQLAILPSSTRVIPYELFYDLFCGPQSVIPCSTPRSIHQMDNPLALVLKSPDRLDFPRRQTPTLNLNLCRFHFELDIKYLTC
jgi:hypothetical protein